MTSAPTCKWVQDRQFELYIGEMKLYNNNDLSPFWTGSAHYGLAVTPQLLDAYDRMRADSSAAPDFETVFAGRCPTSLCYGAEG